MHQTNLRSVDLNLLTALGALLEHCNITRAGAALNLSQPAMSRALSRLRDLFDDPLLVRAGRTMAPTRLALELTQPVQQVLGDIRGLVRPREFDPADARGEFHINAPDATTIVVLSKALNQISHNAPNLDFAITNVSVGRFEAMASGEIDLAVDAFADLPDGFHRESLLRDRLVCVARADHPVVFEGLDSEAYAFWPHAKLATASSGILDRVLENYGMRRRTALTVPNFITAASIVAETSWLLTLPNNLAVRVQEMLPLAILELPFDVPEQNLDQAWHKHSHHDLRDIWVRQQISAIVRRHFPSLVPPVDRSERGSRPAQAGGVIYGSSRPSQ
jgi:DNA-binding transcriptional LysR family regulator